MLVVLLSLRSRDVLSISEKVKFLYMIEIGGKKSYA